MCAVPVDPLTGLRGLLIDIDGVLIMRDRPIAGAAEALATIDRLGLAWRLATNTSAMSRASIAGQLGRLGIDVDADRIISAASAAADHVARRHPGGRVFLLTTPDGRTEFEGLGLQFLTDGAADEALADAHDRGTVGAHDEAVHATADSKHSTGRAEPSGDRSVAAVIIGDASDDMTFRDLDRAFGLIRLGADFIAMHRNRWWLTRRGTTLDAGALVAGLEYSAERKATLTGKPAPTFFAAGVRHLAADVGPPRLRRSEVGMVGDDLWNDVLGAQRAGLGGIFVRSGKHGDAELADAARRRRGGGRPDVIADDLAEVAATLRV